MNDREVLQAADILFHHRLNKSGLKKLPVKLTPKNIQDSYEIQNELKILYLTLKDNICIGKKVGCTNKIAQEQVGVFEPFYGNLFSKFSNSSGCKLKSSKFYKPYVELEISLIINKDININNAPFVIDDAKELFKGIIPSIEIVDFRFASNIKEVGIKNLIVTNGASEYWIKGINLHPLDKINLHDHKVKLYLNDKLFESGNTNSVLGNPINSGLWIINKLAELGEPMLEGQYISTGTCTKALPLIPNSRILADFGLLGKVDFEYN